MQGELALRFVAVSVALLARVRADRGRSPARRRRLSPCRPLRGPVRSERGPWPRWATSPIGKATPRPRGVWYEDQVALAKAANDEAVRRRRRVQPGARRIHRTRATKRSSMHTSTRSSPAIETSATNVARRAPPGRGAILAMGAGRFEEAAESLEQALIEFERLDDPQYRAMTMGSLGWAAFAQGDVPTAARMAVEALLGSLPDAGHRHHDDLAACRRADGGHARPL